MKSLLFVSALALSSAAFAQEAPASQVGVTAKAPQAVVTAKAPQAVVTAKAPQAGVPAKAPAAAVPLSAKSAASHTGKHHPHHRHARQN